jgi:outer membrane protein assembly factor BamB
MRPARLTAIFLSACLAGCSTLDALNPFSSSSGPKMAELQPIETRADVRVLWSEGVGKAGDYTFVPAVVASSVYVAARDGTLARLDGGQPVWRVKAEQALSGGVGADERMLVVGTAKGDLLAFSTADGSLLWKARASSEIVAPPVVSSGLVIVRTVDHRLAAYDAQSGQRKWLYQRPSTPLSLRVTASHGAGREIRLRRLSRRQAAGGQRGQRLRRSGKARSRLPKGATELDRVADVTSAPVIDGRMICAAAFQGRIACFDLGNGNLIWSRDISSAAGLASTAATFTSPTTRGPCMPSTRRAAPVSGSRTSSSCAG